MRTRLWLVGGTAVAIAAMLAWSGGSELSIAPGLGGTTGAAADTASNSPFIDALPLPTGALDWPSLGIGVVIGALLTLMTQVSWFELPKRIVRWFIVNERNLYRIGMAAVFLGVLLFY